MNCKGTALSALPLERTAIFQEEYERQSKQHVKDKEARKKKAKADRREQKSAKKREKKRDSSRSRRFQMSGGARNRFDGQRWIENIIKERTREALERFPALSVICTTIRNTSGRKSYISRNAPKEIVSEKNATNSGTSVEPKQELKTLPKRRQK